jgi:hypothetical protein
MIEIMTIHVIASHRVPRCAPDAKLREAIHAAAWGRRMDCFVASLLAMTVSAFFEKD